MKGRLEGWDLRFENAERETRHKAGEWTGETLAEMVRQRAGEHGSRPAFHEDAASLTFDALLREATALARGLGELGLAPGDTISFQLPNWLEAIVLDVACSFGGFVINPIVPIYREHELRFILNDCRARVVFIPETFRGVNYLQMMARLRSDVADLEHIVVVRSERSGALRYEDLISRGQASNKSLSEQNADALKMIMYTSGTTGQPKGVLYTQNQLRFPLRSSFRAWDLRSCARLLMPSPITHITGFGFGIEMPILFNTQTFLMERWDAAKAVKLIDKHRIDFMVGATPFLAELVDEAERQNTRLESLRIFACGGAPVPPEVVRRANGLFANARAFRVYGSSECFMITQGCREDTNHASTSDGRVCGWDVKIVDDNGRALGNSQEGEVLAKGPGLFRGYTSELATLNAFDSEGYFRTGDLGILSEDGILTITGRKKDIVVRGGENISAKEVEDALHTHPAIAEAAVVAMPHERLGEGVCAFIVPKNDAAPSRCELNTFLNEYGLARQKWPERVEYVEALPKTASGKIQKHILRKEIADRIAAEVIR